MLPFLKEGYYQIGPPGKDRYCVALNFESQSAPARTDGGRLGARLWRLARRQVRIDRSTVRSAYPLHRGAPPVATLPTLSRPG
jgi:hypothetical protein